MKKYLLILVFSLFAFSARALEMNDYSSLYGNWQPRGEEGEIFSGEVRIMALKGRVGKMLLLYDDLKHAIGCSFVTQEDPKDVMCMGGIVSKTDITPDNRIDLVFTPFESGYVVMTFDLQGDVLEVFGICPKGFIEHAPKNLMSVLTRK